MGKEMSNKDKLDRGWVEVEVGYELDVKESCDIFESLYREGTEEVLR
jgi:hypothetical protein